MSRIALIGENSIEYVSELLDIWNEGNCAVLLDWRIPFKTLCQMMVDAEVVECRIDVRLFKTIKISDNGPFLFTYFGNVGNQPQLLSNDIRNKYNENYTQDEAVVLYSSGTTGESKGIILSYYAINTNAKMIIDYMKLNNKDCLFVVKPLIHSSVLTGELLVALQTGADIVLAPTTMIPRFVLSRLSEYKVTTLCLNPTLLRIYSVEQEKKKFDINTLQTIYCSGAILCDRTYLDARRIFKGISICNVYGLTEAGPRVSAQTRMDNKGNNVGKPIVNVNIMITDNNGNIVEQGERGIIHVKTPSQFTKYVSGQEKLTSWLHGWLNTGDTGFIDENGDLHIVGRFDEMINLDSHKIYPSDIENKILEDTRILECVVREYTMEDTPIIGCIYVGDKVEVSSIVQRLKKTMLRYEIPSLFIKEAKIPRNKNGKIDQHAVTEIFRNYTCK